MLLIEVQKTSLYNVTGSQWKLFAHQFRLPYLSLQLNHCHQIHAIIRTLLLTPLIAPAKPNDFD